MADRLTRLKGRVLMARHRWYRGLVVAAGVGVLTGLVVAAFDTVTLDGLYDHVSRAPEWVWLAAPTAGLTIAALCLARLAPGASPATSDEYVKWYHRRGERFPLRPVPGKALASVATLGSGGALGYEGPAIYLGAAIGSAAQRRFRALFSAEDAKVGLVAGAAAGVAAIFRAPATAAVFALTVPYQDASAGRATLPALVASATSYLTFVALKGTTPLFAVKGDPAFRFPELAGAALLGVLCGVGARGFAYLLNVGKRIAAATPAVPRVLGAGAVLAGLGAWTNAVYGAPYALGNGYAAVHWAEHPGRGLALVALLFAIRAVAAATTLAGGGVGGTFVPLVVQGVLLGQLVGTAIGGGAATLLPVVGMAAFLGAGYRTPIAAVMFVAESTGRPGFVVPGLIATAVAQLAMGRASVSAYQHMSPEQLPAASDAAAPLP